MRNGWDEILIGSFCCRLNGWFNEKDACCGGQLWLSVWVGGAWRGAWFGLVNGHFWGEDGVKLFNRRFIYFSFGDVYSEEMI